MIIDFTPAQRAVEIKEKEIISRSGRLAKDNKLLPEPLSASVGAQNREKAGSYFVITWTCSTAVDCPACTCSE